MAYATNAKLTLLTGTALSTTILDEIIAQSDREIVARLALAGLGAPSSDTTLEGASLNLSIAGVLTRMRIDGSKPASLRIGDISISDDLDSAITELVKRAWESVESYIKNHGANLGYRYYIRKVNP